MTARSYANGRMHAGCHWHARFYSIFVSALLSELDIELLILTLRKLTYTTWRSHPR